MQQVQDSLTSQETLQSKSWKGATQAWTPGLAHYHPATVAGGVNNV